MSLQVGSVVEGVVVSIAKFGAFVQLPEGKTGLVHISEIAEHYVEDIKQYLKENDRIKVKIISIDDRGKISLSLRQAGIQLKKSSRPVEIDWEAEKRFRTKNLSFEDRLAKFLKDSEDRQQHLKSKMVPKKNGRSKKGGF